MHEQNANINVFKFIQHSPIEWNIQPNKKLIITNNTSNFHDERRISCKK